MNNRNINSIFLRLKTSDIKNTGQITRYYKEEMANNSMIRRCLLVFGLFLFFTDMFGSGITLPGTLDSFHATSDTIPLKDRTGDFITDKTYNPFDIYPSDIEQTVEYDPETNTYIVYEKIGDEYFRAPTYLTFEEYIQWKEEKQQREYFEKLAGFKEEYNSKGTALIDPLSKINIEKNLLDRLFGGNDITIEPQGNIDLTFGMDYRRDDNPNLDASRRNQPPLFDFDMDIKMNVEGNIGDKMDLGFNYDTNASFDFDRKIKLAYDSEKFSEDDIIKKIEAGNVSLPLRGTLIQGAQSLFGLKTELQFGHLRLTGIASQQRSRQETQTIQNGATVQEFELRPDDYDENRHFFISHYHRSTFEEKLTNLPYINNNMRVTNIEVWISDDRLDYQQNQTMICAIADLAEPEREKFSKTNADYYIEDMMLPRIYFDEKGRKLPENSTNELYDELIGDDQVKRIERTHTRLQSQYKLEDPRDFSIYQGRKLNQSEFTFNEELGFISLNIRLRPQQNLSVSYEYFYTLACDDIYKVGSTTDETNVPNTNSNGEVESQGVIFTKMLKSNNQKVNHPTWDLMMKNVYPLRTNSLSEVDFQFDIFFEDDADGSLKKFLPESKFRNQPLLNIFGLDKLNSRNDPQPDGKFDFVPGVTVVPQSSSIVFPVLEPFGRSLQVLINDKEIAEKYSFPELYDTTVTGAREILVKNKFVMAGRVKSDVSAEYSLGAWNIPQGSVRVTAGGQQLLEGQDYEVDYAIGRVRIINESYLQSGVPINVSYEDNSVFSLQQKTMLGLRADYSVNENFHIGATLMRLFERPFTEKVNIGDDPINNHMYGLDVDFSSEVPWLTRAVDKLPFLSTDVPSNVNFTAEVAVLDPSHSGAINLNNDDGGVVSIDDFEGAVSGFPLNSQALNIWSLASVPETDQFRESDQINSLNSGVNRARLSWYVFEQFRGGASTTNTNAYTRNISQQELFNRQIPQGVTGNLLTFDMTYNPTQRGPYNFDGANGTDFSSGSTVDDDGNVILKDPETRWAGIMRYMSNSDFEASNYQFIEFWLLNPYMEKADGSSHEDDDDGFLTFHLGNVSEDIIKDNLQFYENTLPVDDEELPIVDKAYGKVSLAIPKTDGFDNERQEQQDLGLDGMTNEEERLKFQDYIQSYGSQPVALLDDPSGDDYVYYNDNDKWTNEDLVTRYSKFNNPEGNSPNISGSNDFVRGNPRPDKEDLNNNRSLDQSESFYEYKIPIEQVTIGGERQLDVDNNEFIREVRTVEPPNSSTNELWYRFRIPIREGVAFNGIEGFRSIQFMRLIVNGFKTQKTFRMAEFELIRNQWRKLPSKCSTPDGFLDPDLTIDAVGIEENGSKTPYPYVLPRGIKQERVFNTFSNVLQNEKSLSLVYERMLEGCESSIYKLNELDLRLYKKLQMFVHAEKKDFDIDQESGDMAVFIRLGKDFDRHYYEYEIPLTLSSDTLAIPPGTTQSDIVWPSQNFIDMQLDWFIQAKKLRTVMGGSYVDTFAITDALIKEAYESDIDEFSSINFEIMDTILNPDGSIDTFFLPEGHKISIVGNPNLARIKGIEIGVRNINDDSPINGHSGEVWVNELRLTGLQERGGVAGLARIDVQLADFGNVAASGSFSSIGWGAIDQKVQDRSIEAVQEYDLSTNLELGKILPNGWNLSVPFYAQYAKSVRTPEFDAYDLDIKVEDEYNLFKENGLKQDSIRSRNQIVNTIKSFNFTNVRKQRGGNNKVKAKKKDDKKGGKNNQANPDPPKTKKPRKPMPWDIENFSATYAYTQTEYSDAIIESEITKDYTFGLNYKYSRKIGYIQPFKKVKGKFLKFIKEINFNPLPNSFSFNSDMNRFISERTFRIPDSPIFKFDDRRFEWERRYDLNWNLTKGLKVTYSAINESYIDELRQRGIAQDPSTRDYYNELGDNIGQRSSSEVKDYWQDNVMSGGRNTNFSHSASANYTLPMKFIPYLEWVDIKAKYNTNYSWAAGPLINIQDGTNVGNIIQNNQERSVTANFDLEKLYNKSKYIKNLDKIKRAKKKSSRTRTTTSEDKKVEDKDEKDGKSKRKKDKEPSKIEKILVRPLFMFRSLRINYKENFSTVVPGFNPTPEFLGLSEGFSAPGFDFIFGAQPDISFGNTGNWLYESAAKGWITSSTALNQEVIQTSGQNIDAKIKLEPWNDFKINIDFQKSYRNTQQQDFKFIDKDGFSGFTQLANRNLGSFEMSYSALNTLFADDIDELFSRFEFSRSVISFRHENNDPSGAHVDGVNFARGYGKQSSRVLVPAFLAAYTNRDPNTIDLELEKNVSQLDFIPRPNWDIKYDGLNKLPWFRDMFSSFSLTHGYSSKLRVNSFNSDVEFDPASPYSEIKPNGNYYSRIDIPSIQISEQFNPIIGVKLKTKNDLTLDFAYKKSRTLDLLINVSSELAEMKKTEYVFEFGYIIKDAKLFKKKNKRPKRGKKAADDKKNKGKGIIGGNNVNSTRGSDMTIAISFSIIDDITQVHELDFGDSQPTRGGNTISFSPSVDYVLNDNLTLRAFLEYNSSKPYVRNTYGFTTISGGLTMRMSLN